MTQNALTREFVPTPTGRWASWLGNRQLGRDGQLVDALGEVLHDPLKVPQGDGQ